MGQNRFKKEEYTAKVDDLKAKGVTAHTYTQTARAQGLGMHDSLNPTLSGPRESNTPVSGAKTTSVTFMIDITGSGGAVPGYIRDDLPQFLGLVNLDNYLGNTAVQVIGLGDAGMGDRYPLQVSQFETDVKNEANLRNLFIEGGGGGNKRESYDLALWYATYCNRLVDWERGDKGYLFIVGDEMPYGQIKGEEIVKHIGPKAAGENMQSMPLPLLMEDLLKKYHVWYIICQGSHYYDDPEITNTWKSYLGGENVIKLADPRDISELAASLVGSKIGINLNQVKKDLVAQGSTQQSVDAVTMALVAAGMSITPINLNKRITRL
jgi:hypothetical protein